MEYICKNESGYKLHIIKTTKFKTVTLRISFRRKANKKEITMRNVLGDMLTISSKKYPSKRELTIKAQDLYAAHYHTATTRLGSYFNTDIYMSTLNDKYTEEGNLEKAIEFLKEILLNPDVENNKFKDDKLDIIKSEYRDYLKSIKDSSARYSLIRMLEEYDKTSPVSYNMYGYLDDLDNINVENLYNYYQSILKKDLVDIFILGDIDVDYIENIIKEKFKFNTLKVDKKDYIIPSKKARSRIKKVIETDKKAQSKLVIGARLDNLNDYERRYAATLFNIIFGGESDSKLFKEVREKNSLCYSIYSVANKIDNLLIIRSGIDKENYVKSVKLIKKCLSDMQKGLFSEEDISVAKEYYNTALDGIVDNENRIIDDYYIQDLLGIDPIEKRREMVSKVTKEDIINVAKKVFIDTVYFLEGVKNETD